MLLGDLDKDLRASKGHVNTQTGPHCDLLYYIHIHHVLVWKTMLYLQNPPYFMVRHFSTRTLTVSADGNRWKTRRRQQLVQPHVNIETACYVYFTFLGTYYYFQIMPS